VEWRRRGESEDEWSGGGEGSKGGGVEGVMSYNRDWSINDLES
jgi:hypothetical protein